MSKNITQQRDIYDTVIFRFLQILYMIYIYIYIDQNLKIKRKVKWVVQFVKT